MTGACFPQPMRYAAAAAIPFRRRTATLGPRLKKLMLAAGALSFCLALAEGLVRVLGLAPDDRLPISSEPGDGGVQPVCVLTDGPELYVLNPQHPDVSPQGLRNDPVAIPKPDGVFRILVLGDSIPYGIGVARDAALPQVLQARLRERRPDVEVVNAGVPGYSPYNELHWYENRGRPMQPDLVLVVLCLNDVVNPRLHWNATAGHLVVIPDAAIPDLEFDRTVVRAEIAKALAIDPEALSRRKRSWLDGSALFRFVRQRTARWFAAPDPIGAAVGTRRRGPPPPAGVETMLSAEQGELGIQVLLDPESPERRWLADIYRELRAAVEADGARLAVAIAPLAYQLEPGYPLLPQRELAARWNAEGLPCLDLLPALAQHPQAEMFLLARQPAYYDIWHLTEAGHAVVAEEVARFLAERHLLERR